ncbi:hypothetical protein [Serratia sp. (in: enterobacteria)]|uniref:hypothetical protein n=1 Tax=Serratia sp. (in: enterobacteria) TaxID=616 RepID=UPI00398A34F7
MVKSINMDSLRFSATGASIYHLERELDGAGFPLIKRSPICYSPGAIEFLEIAFPAGAGVAAIHALSKILIAYINKDRSAECSVIIGGKEHKVRASTEEGVLKILAELKAQSDSEQG